ncbi:MAG: hypothetical protein IID38_04915 [Planctomycetes bacterium]|nr:hypothetical protein [Planctomycetota bacterium]
MTELSELVAKILSNPTCAEPIIFSLIKPRDVEIERLKADNAALREKIERLKEDLANNKSIVDYTMRFLGKDAATEFLTHKDQAEEIERLKKLDENQNETIGRRNSQIKQLKEEKFLPLGDNHHNALACPYCNGPLKEENEQLQKANCQYSDELEQSAKGNVTKRKEIERLKLNERILKERIKNAEMSDPEIAKELLDLADECKRETIPLADQVEQLKQRLAEATMPENAKEQPCPDCGLVDVIPNSPDGPVCGACGAKLNRQTKLKEGDDA